MSIHEGVPQQADSARVVTSYRDYGTQRAPVTLVYEPAVHCPNCCARWVWREIGDGDAYNGPANFCAACGGSFKVYATLLPEESPIMEAIRAATLSAIRETATLSAESKL